MGMSTLHQESVTYSAHGRRARDGTSVITQLMEDKLANPRILSLAAGFTDNHLLPRELVTELAGELGREEANQHLQYGMNCGNPALRKAVIELLRGFPGEENLALDADDVLVTNGSQQALYLLVQALCDPGDIVLVEKPSYFVFLELLRGLGVRAVSLPSAEDGALDERLLSEFFGRLSATGELNAVRLIYLMGVFANPSTRCLAESSKRALGRCLKRLPRQIPVVEDMAYRDLYFEEPDPSRSLLALPEWKGLPVLYAGTFTKPFSTGLKVGFIVSREEALMTTMAKFKGHQDFGTSHFDQAILERSLSDGRYGMHLESIRPQYQRKCRLLQEALLENGLVGAGWGWEDPRGGLLLWARGPDGLDTRRGSRFYERALDAEILYVPGDLCFAEGRPWNCVRLSFGALPEEMIPEAARRFCQVALEEGSPSLK